MSKNVLVTSVMTTILAFSFGAGQALAANDDAKTDVINVEMINEDQLTDSNTESLDLEAEEVSFEDMIPDIEEDQAEDETVEEIEEENPSLLPGDFFYFAKKLMENVQLALTFDNVKEVELLASYVDERMKEAEALLAEGEEELANEVLQLAIEQQELALEKYEQIEPAKDADAIIEVVDGEDEQEQEQEQVDPIRAELEEKFSANLLALQTALENVENPTAKEALAKNIVKAQKRLDRKVNKRLAKLEEKEQKTNKEQTELEPEPIGEEINVEVENPEGAEPKAVTVNNSNKAKSSQVEKKNTENHTMKKKIVLNTEPKENQNVAVEIQAQVAKREESKVLEENRTEVKPQVEKGKVDQAKKAEVKQNEAPKKDAEKIEKEKKQEVKNSYGAEKQANNDRGNGNKEKNNNK